MYSLSIPRAVCLLAGVKYQERNGEGIFNVEAKQGSDTFGVVHSPFMMDKAKATAFRMELSVKNNELIYREVTSLDDIWKNI